MALFENQKGYEGEEGTRTLLTITGDSAVVEGKLKVSKSIEIDCEIKGQLDIDGLIVIQKSGYVNADVKTADAQIIGKYEGSMEASGNVEIKETGIVSGNIKTDSLIINKGGIFSGNVTRITEGSEFSKKKAKTTSSIKDLISSSNKGERKFSDTTDDSDSYSNSDSNSDSDPNLSL